MRHDFWYLTGFIALGAAVVWGSRRLSTAAYSRMLIAVIALGIVAVGWFNAIAVLAEGDSLVHATVLAFAQFGVLALASKVWLALNWERFDRSTHRIVHLFAHTALLFVIVESIEELVRQREDRPMA